MWVSISRPISPSIPAMNWSSARGLPQLLVKLKAINRIDATETESFGFYLIIRQAQVPVWRDVSELTMRAGSSYDLFQLVESGLETPPTIALSFWTDAADRQSRVERCIHHRHGLAARQSSRHGRGAVAAIIVFT